MLLIALLVACGEEESAPQVWAETVSYDCDVAVQGDAITVTLPAGTKGWALFQCGSIGDDPWTCLDISRAVIEYDYAELFVPCDDTATTAELRAWGIR